MDFMSFKTDSCKAQLNVYLARISKEMHMNRNVSICLILASYVGTQEWCGDDVVALPPHILMRCWAQHLRPDSMVWPDHLYCVWPCQACQKYSCTVRSVTGLQHSPPHMKYHGLNEEKNLYRKKIISLWVKWHVQVVSLDTNNRKRKSIVRVENKLDEGNS